MADDDDLITIVDVTDPDDPQYSDMKTRKRALTAIQLANLRTTLQKVGAYQFFSREFNFSDGPAVLQFIDTVEVDEIKPTKTHKVVQDTFKGTVAGRDVVIDAALIEKAFGLVDDGENIAKPRGDNVSGLHTFYIKPHHVDECQSKRGVNLGFLKTEYMHLKNLAHQIQVYCCGIEEDDHVKFTVYRALDFVLRSKPVNWNRYLLQNMQERLRRYKRSPCPLYFGGMLTALIYKALNLNYELVNKLPPPASQEKALTAGNTASGKKSTPSTGKSVAVAKSKVRKLTSDAESLEETAPATRSSARVKMRMQRDETAAIEWPCEPVSSGGKRRQEEENPVASPSSKRAKAAVEDEAPSSRKKAVEEAKKKSVRTSEGSSKKERAVEETEDKETEDEEAEEDVHKSGKSVLQEMKSPATRSSIRVKMKLRQGSESGSPKPKEDVLAPKKRTTGGKKRKEMTDTDATDMETEDKVSEDSDSDDTEEGHEYLDTPGISRRHGLLMLNGSANIPEVLANKNYRLSTLYNQAMGTPITDRLPLTEAKDLWQKYTQYYALGQECHLEHIISKQKQESLESKIEEMERALKARDDTLGETVQRMEELELELKSKADEVEKLSGELSALKNKHNR